MIIPSTFDWIRQHRMRLIDLLEKRGRFCRLIFIRVEYNCQPSICTLDILRPRVPADSQYFIIVFQLSKLIQKKTYKKVVIPFMGTTTFSLSMD